MITRNERITLAEKNYYNLLSDKDKECYDACRALEIESSKIIEIFSKYLNESLNEEDHSFYFYSNIQDFVLKSPEFFKMTFIGYEEAKEAFLKTNEKNPVVVHKGEIIMEYKLKFYVDPKWITNSSFK